MNTAYAGNTKNRGKRILLLGGGSSQLNAARRIKEEGYTLVLADQNPSAPGRKAADEFAQVSTFDQQGITAAVKERSIDYILTLGTDQPVLTAAVAAQANGLPFPLSPEQALWVTNKKFMKNKLQKGGFPVSHFAVCRKEHLPGAVDHLTFPAVVKPLDSQGQRGVMRLTSSGEVAEKFPRVISFSRAEEIIIEEYYPSKEVTVSGWVHDGTVFILTITDRVTRPNFPSLGVCFAHRFPSRFASGREREIVQLTEDITEYFGIRNGPLYFQFLIGERGIIINELACRLGGAYEDESIPQVTGVDILELLITESTRSGLYPLPRSLAELKERGSRGCFSVPLLFCREGTASRFYTGEKTSIKKEIRNIQFLHSPGTRIHPLQNSTQRAGYAVIYGENTDEVNEAVDVFFDNIAIFDESGNNILIDSREDCYIGK